MNNIPTRPRRFLVPAHEIGPGMGSLPPMSEAEAEVWQALPVRTVPKLDDDVLAIIRSLRQKRYVRQRGSVFEARPELALSCDPKPEWVWLPNAIIDGVDGKTPAVELIRQTQDIATLRLFIDLYHVQSLSFDGGIPTDLLRKTYSRKKVAFDGALVAWSFEHASYKASVSSPFYQAFLADSPADGSQHFWDALFTLERLGVATFVEHLFDGPGGEAEIIHPMAKPLPGRDITEAEGELYEAASTAARKLYAAHNALPSEQEMVLVPEHIAKVELRGVLRLRHRPHTSVTAEWMAQSERWREYTAYFRDVFLPTSKTAA